MTAQGYFFDSFSRLVDLSPRSIKRNKNKKTNIELNYDVVNTSVEAAWDDVQLSLAESWAQSVSDDVFDQRLQHYKSDLLKSAICVDISSEIPLTFLQPLIDNGYGSLTGRLRRKWIKK